MDKINKQRPKTLKIEEKFKGGEKNESDIANGIIYKQKKEKQMQQEEKYLQN